MTLNKKEKVVMKIIYNKAKGKNGQILVSPLDILMQIPAKMDFKESDLPSVLYDLSLEGYFTYTEAKKKNDDVYVITLGEAGLAYERTIIANRKKIIKRFIIVAIGAVLSFFVKLILDAII